MSLTIVIPIFLQAIAISQIFMQSRQGITELFSTFIQLESDRFSGWVTDPKLRRSMQHCLEQTAQPEPEQFWALYWHRIWQTQASRLAADHIAAYLQEVCYWTARKIAMNLPGQPSIADFFQMSIARLNKILKGFNPQLSSNLKSYAEFTFGNVIKDSLRQRQEADICTDWALLNKLSQKRLVKALQQAGMNEPTISRYVLAWRCFQELYAPGDTKTTRKQSQPDAAGWRAITHLYNTERLSQLNPVAAECSPERMELWLTTCAKAARSFLYPAFISVNASRPGQDTGELLDSFPVHVHASVLADIVAQEEAESRQAQIAQMNQLLANALTELDAQSQALLQAYYGQELTQQQIAQQLSVQQYTISRRLSKLRRVFLLTLVRWSQETLHLSLTSDVMDSISNILEEWLIARYRYSESSF